MKLQEAKDNFYKSSGTLSELLRKLVFAGIGIIWILKVGDKDAGGLKFQKDLYLPLFLFTLSITLDVFQYVYKSTTWWLYYEFKHRAGVKDDADIDPSGLWNLPTFVFYYGKVLVGALGFIYLLAKITFQLI